MVVDRQDTSYSTLLQISNEIEDDLLYKFMKLVYFIVKVVT